MHKLIFLLFFINTLFITSNKNLIGKEYTNKIIDPILMKCEISPEFYIMTPLPSNFVYSNNLRRKSGSPYVADGVPIRIMGRVLDSNCIPISNAVVNIWHTNNNGIYQIEQDKNYFPVEWDRYFNGTGTAITDNLGYYYFLTIYPHPEKDNLSSTVNFRIHHKDFVPIQTIMFFKKENLKKKLNSGLSTIPESKYSLVNATTIKTQDKEITFEFNIIMKGINKIYEQNPFDKANSIDPLYLEKFSLKKEEKNDKE